MALLLRVPALILAALYLLLITRQGDQVAVLVEMLSFPRDHWRLFIISFVTGIMLWLLAERRSGWWLLVDLVIFFLPLWVLTYTLFSSAWPPLGLITIAGCVVVLGILLDRIARPSWKLTALICVVIVAIWAAFFIGISAAPVEFPRKVGALALTFCFLGLCAAGLQIALRHPMIGVPALAVVAGSFLFHEEGHVLNQVDLTNQESALETPLSESPQAKEVATAQGSPQEAPSRPPFVRTQVSLQQAFHVWLASRNDLEEYRRRKRPYPVFLVTSEGGGGYAAAHAYLFLSKLQKRCPNFAQHVFAIVGVSGGAVGNSMFRAALTKSVNPSTYQRCSGEADTAEQVRLLATDHLSPVIAALLFRDFPNKISFGAFGPPDRADALAASLASSLGRDPAEANPLYWDHYWATANKSEIRLGETPAIVHVATNAVSGKRYIFAPFAFSFVGDRIEEALNDLNWEGPDEAGPRSSDIRLMDAAVASASFPWITPSRVLEGRLQERIALVDGGYLEASGAETVRDIVAELQFPNPAYDGASIVPMQPPRSSTPDRLTAGCDLPRIEYVPRTVGTEEVPSYGDNEDACRILIELHVITIRAEVPYQRGVNSQNFFVDPLTALLSARSRRGETARFGLLSQLCGRLYCPPQVEDVADWGFMRASSTSNGLRCHWDGISRSPLYRSLTVSWRRTPIRM
jgi:hypothetical protein